MRLSTPPLAELRVRSAHLHAGAEIDSLLAVLAELDYRIGRLRQLPANPLLLTILCLVHHEDHSLPRRRADVYARCVRVRLEHWRKDLRETQGLTPFDPTAAENALAVLAWWLHAEEHRTSAALAELAGQATPVLAELDPDAGLGRDGEGFVRRMRDESGILASWGSGKTGFLHLTFQEHLAGTYAAQENRARDLVARIGSSWWREVILVALAMGSKAFIHEFFAALLAGDVERWDVSLVDQCVDESAFKPIEPFVAALQDSRSEAGRLAAILRRVRTLEHPDLSKVCQELARSGDRTLAALAIEVLQRGTPADERWNVERFQDFVDPHTGMTFVSLPAGEFRMGSYKISLEERPVHRVSLSAFTIAKYPVTNADYGRFLKENASHRKPGFWNDSQFNKPQKPVVGVSWEDAQAFCVWAGARLPTEAEWEYACRARTDTEYCFGDDPRGLDAFGWYGDNSGRGPHAVGEKSPNGWGLHDCHGNVWEWCADRYGEYPSSEVTDPTGPNKGRSRVLRGGCWHDPAGDCRSASRGRSGPANRDLLIGFRVVLAPRSVREAGGKGR